MRQSLVGKELSDLRALPALHGQARFRAQQLYDGLYRRRCAELEEIRVLPGELRRELGAAYEPGLPPVAGRFVSVDGAVRYLLALEDGKSVETVFIPEPSRDTLCISTQLGCSVDCKFCLTARMGLERNLSAGEIVGQVLTLIREHRLEPRRRPLNIVMMGMGEPLLNLEATLKASRLLADPAGIAVPLRRITVSTAGITPRIEEFSRREERPKLAVSLNAPTQELRERLMPITRNCPLDELIELCRRYPLRPWERLTFEYVLLAGVNDSEREARQTAKLVANIRCRVNLIALNPSPGIPFETPSPERVEAFRRIVSRSVGCSIRKPRGRDVYAACGQLKRMAGAAARDDLPRSGSVC